MTDYKKQFNQVVAQLNETHDLHNYGRIICVEEWVRVRESMDRAMAKDNVPKRRREQYLREVESGGRSMITQREGSSEEERLMFRPVYYPSGAFFSASKGMRWLGRSGALEGSVLKILMDMCETTSTWTYTEYTQKWREGRKVEKKLKKMKRQRGKQNTKWVSLKDHKCKGKRR